MNSIFVLCTVNPCEVTVHAQEKKKLKNVKRGRRIQLNPNAHYVTVWIQHFPFFFFLLLRVSGREETNFTVHETNVTVHAVFWYCSWDPHPFYSK